ncbi:MAG TPA: hypothetical protein VFW17_04625 [Ktedonobacterales bacterium]|jgi:hypothetical protein|nr:hypothetical protein [Ktedonobacterales bacterium]
MKRLVQIVSLATLITVVAAMVAQALTVTQGITYDQNGQPVNPSTLTLIVTILGVAGMLSLPLTAVDGVLGIIGAGLAQHYVWLIAVVVAGLLALVGFFVMIWILLSVESPIAFQTPFVLVPLVTLAYTLAPASPRTVAAGAH